jgi:hypothetical protein
MGLIYRTSSLANVGASSIKNAELTYEEGDGNIAFLLTNLSGSNVSIDGNTTVNGPIQLNGTLQADGIIYASNLTSASQNYTVTYDTGSGRLYYTASSAILGAAPTLQQVTDKGKITTNNIEILGQALSGNQGVNLYAGTNGLSGTPARVYIYDNTFGDSKTLTILGTEYSSSGYSLSIARPILGSSYTLTYPTTGGFFAISVNSTASNAAGNITITTVPTASFVTASNVFGPHGSSSVVSSSYAISSSFAQSASYIPNLQQVTDQGATTTNSISVGNGSFGSDIQVFAIGHGGVKIGVDQVNKGYINIERGSGIGGIIKSNNLSAGRTYQLPDNSGTIALVSDTGSLIATASANSNEITFTKGNGTQFTISVNTGSAITTPTASLLVTASVSLNTITFTKGDGSTFPITVNTGSGGSGLSGGTQYYVPVWTGASTLGTSSLYESGSVLKSVYGGNDIGLKLDFVNNQYWIGDEAGVNSGSVIKVNDGSSQIQLLAGVANTATSLILEDNPGYIYTQYQSSDIGLRLDFSSSKYELGQLTGGNQTKLTIDDATQTIALTGSLQVTGSTYLRGLTSASQANVLTYNSSTGQVFFTASSAIGGGGSPIDTSTFLTTGSITTTQGITGSLQITGSLGMTGSIIVKGPFDGDTMNHNLSLGTLISDMNNLSGSLGNRHLPVGYDNYRINYNESGFDGRSKINLWKVLDNSFNTLNPLHTTPVTITNYSGYDGWVLPSGVTTIENKPSQSLAVGEYIRLYYDYTPFNFDWKIIERGRINETTISSGNTNVTQSISGSLNITGSLNFFSGSQQQLQIQNGILILSQVSASLDFANDAAAAAGGVPLGGLYRNGNAISIRIV